MLGYFPESKLSSLQKAVFWINLVPRKEQGGLGIGESWKSEKNVFHCRLVNEFSKYFERNVACVVFFDFEAPEHKLSVFLSCFFKVHKNF